MAIPAKIRKLMAPGVTAAAPSLGLLALRIGAGGMMAYAHGWGKLTTFVEKSGSFPDPLGLGSVPSMALAVFAEFFCSILLVLGFATRLAAIPPITTMLVAIFIIHADDPFEKKELAIMYLAPFIALLLSGAGRYSLDGKFGRGN